jgi:hypothetical protein
MSANVVVFEHWLSIIAFRIQCFPISFKEYYPNTSKQVRKEMELNFHKMIKNVLLYESETMVSKSTIFLDITPYSPLSVNRRGHLLSRSFLAELIFSTLKVEAIYSSETSVDTQRTTRLYIPEDGTLHNHRCENLKSYICLVNFKQWE